MRHPYRYVLVLVAILMLAGATVANSTTYNYTHLTAPGAYHTEVWGINDASQVVGHYDDVSGTHGFIYSDGTYTTLNVSGASLTMAKGINDAGQVVGVYRADGYNYGFIYSAGVYTLLNTFSDCIPYGINNTGQIVGTGGPTYGFLYSAGNYTNLLYPDSQGTWAYGINNTGQVVGVSASPVKGFVYSAGNYTGFDNTGFFSINNVGQVVGVNTSTWQGFLLSDGVYTTLDFEPWGINDRGQITGHNGDFIATPVPLPPSLLFFGSGLLGLAVVRRRFRKS